MSGTPLDVELTVEDALFQRTSPEGRTQLAAAVTAAVTHVIASLGIRSAPQVSVLPGPIEDVVDGGPFLLTVADRRCPVRAGTLGDAVQTVLAPTGDDGSIDTVLADLGAGTEDVLARLAGRWCEGVLDAAPSLLLPDAEERERAEELGLPAEEASSLRALLAHRVSLTRADAHPYGRGEDEQSPQSWREELLDRSAQELSLRCHPGLLRRLTLAGDPAERSVVADTRQAVFDSLGVLLPRLRLVPDGQLPQDCFAFGVGDLVTPARRAVPAGWQMVPTGAGDDRGPQPDARPWWDPMAGRRTELVPWAPEGIDGLAYIARGLHASVRDNAPCLVTTGSVDQALELTAAIYPVLVAAVRSQYGSVKLTVLLRELAREGVSLRHLPPMLERLDELALGLTGPERDLGTLLRGAAAWATSDGLRRGDVSLLALAEDGERALIEASTAWEPWLPPSDAATTALHRAYRSRCQDGVAAPPAVLARNAPDVVGRALRAVFPAAPVLGPADVVPEDLAADAQPMQLA